MRTHEEIRDICRELPGSIEGDDRFGFSVLVKGKYKGYCWTWMERVEPKKPKVENPRVLAIRTPNVQAKEILLESGAEWFFEEPHYAGYPAILVKLDLVPLDELKDLLLEAWRTQAGAQLVKNFEASQEPPNKS